MSRHRFEERLERPKADRVEVCIDSTKVPHVKDPDGVRAFDAAVDWPISIVERQKPCVMLLEEGTVLIVSPEAVFKVSIAPPPAVTPLAHVRWHVDGLPALMDHACEALRVRLGRHFAVDLARAALDFGRGGLVHETCELRRWLVHIELTPLCLDAFVAVGVALLNRTVWVQLTHSLIAPRNALLRGEAVWKAAAVSHPRARVAETPALCGGTAQLIE